MDVNPNPDWVSRGKTIRGLIRELESFADQDLEVRISTDNGATFKCISLVSRESGEAGLFCGLANHEAGDAA